MGKNEVKSKLTTLLVQVEMKKGEEYVNAFRDVQRLEEEKRRLSTEEKENKGWLK
jgi:ligand-binding sensor protein